MPTIASPAKMALLDRCEGADVRCKERDAATAKAAPNKVLFSKEQIAAKTVRDGRVVTTQNTHAPRRQTRRRRRRRRRNNHTRPRKRARTHTRTAAKPQWPQSSLSPHTTCRPNWER